MLKQLLFFTFISISPIAFSQDYVVTLRSDTLKGKVKILSYDLIDRVEVKQEKKTVLTGLQVRRVSLNGEQYAPVRIENSVRLMKVVRSGYLSLYAYRAPGAAGYDARIIQKIGKNAIEVPNIGFKKFIGELVEDCASLSERVKGGDFDRNSVDKLIDEYNICVTSNNIQKPVDPVVTTIVEKSAVSDLIEEMKSKVNASDVANKSDINDLLTSIGERHKKKESVPAYMKEGLKGYLASRDDLKGDMEKLFSLLDQ